jgi:DNA polymerase V
MSIAFGNVIGEEFASLTLFTDVEEEVKERNIQKAILSIKKKYGKNSIVKGMDLQEKATTKKRNKLVGGHNGE